MCTSPKYTGEAAGPRTTLTDLGGAGMGEGVLFTGPVKPQN